MSSPPTLNTKLIIDNNIYISFNSKSCYLLGFLNLFLMFLTNELKYYSNSFNLFKRYRLIKLSVMIIKLPHGEPRLASFVKT